MNWLQSNFTNNWISRSDFRGLLEIIRSTTAYYLRKYLLFEKISLMKYIGFCTAKQKLFQKSHPIFLISGNIFCSLFRKKLPLHKVVKEPDAFKQLWICPFINFEFTFLGLKCLKIKMLMVQILVVCPWQPWLKWLPSKRVPGSW